MSEAEIRRASTTFLGLDKTVNVRYEAGSTTRFRVVADEQTGEEYGEVVFSEDLFPGRNLTNPNSTLSMPAAAAHELTHHYRWRDKRELDGAALRHLDEAMTSLEAAQMFSKQLTDIEVLQLIGDAAERLRLHVQAVQDEVGD